MLDTGPVKRQWVLLGLVVNIDRSIGKGLKDNYDTLADFLRYVLLRGCVLGGNLSSHLTNDQRKAIPTKLKLANMYFISLVIKVLYPMTQAILDKLISQLEVLEIEELQKLSQAINIRLNTVDESVKLDSLYSSLLTSGLVSHVKPIYSEQKPRLSLISMQGDPISQTIIEDRR